MNAPETKINKSQLKQLLNKYIDVKEREKILKEAHLIPDAKTICGLSNTKNHNTKINLAKLKYIVNKYINEAYDNDEQNDSEKLNYSRPESYFNTNKYTVIDLNRIPEFIRKIKNSTNVIIHSINVYYTISKEDATDSYEYEITIRIRTYTHEFSIHDISPTVNENIIKFFNEFTPIIASAHNKWFKNNSQFLNNIANAPFGAYISMKGRFINVDYDTNTNFKHTNTDRLATAIVDVDTSKSESAWLDIDNNKWTDTNRNWTDNNINWNGSNGEYSRHK